MIFLDTHVAVWVYGEGLGALSRAAKQALRDDIDVRVSPMVRLEIEYLYEMRRIASSSETVLNTLGATMGLRVCPAGFDAVIHEAARQTWTRDPFDRVIVGHAALYDAPLITKDGPIREHYSRALW